MKKKNITTSDLCQECGRVSRRTLIQQRGKLDEKTMQYNSFEQMPEDLLDNLANATHDEITAQIILECGIEARKDNRGAKEFDMTGSYKAFLDGATGDFDVAAQYLGCTSGTLRVWVSKRKVPFTKVGRLTRFRRTTLDNWLEKNSVEAHEDSR